MTDFLSALTSPDMPFLRYALLAGLMASVPFGLIGSLVVAKRISYLAGAISHSVLGGIGLALYLRARTGLAWCDPIYGALAAALAAALIIGFVSLYARQREDTVIGAIWAVGMAAGLLFIAKTPGYVNAMSYLFGDILLITRGDLYVIGGLDAVIVLACVLFYNKFLALCFDEEFTALRGLNVQFYYLLLLCLTALIVGIVLVIALLTLPAAIAGHFSRRLLAMMILAVLICMVITALGLGVSYHYNLPGGSTIIILAGAVYLLVAVGQQIFRHHRRKAS
jgi:zinc transport system permease protein